MTLLINAVHVEAPPALVWAALARLDGLHELDPGVAASRLLGDARSGIGAARRCELQGGGWFEDRVTRWVPEHELELTLFDCTLPVARLRHAYVLTPEGGGTRVDQQQEYTLKHGPLGALLDRLFVRRKWDGGVKSFLAGLKRHVEAQSGASASSTLSASR